MSNILEWYTKHAKRLDKKYYAKGESIYVLHRRTLQTAKSIIDLIDDIPADDLFLELYMLVKDKEFGIFVVERSSLSIESVHLILQLKLTLFLLFSRA